MNKLYSLICLLLFLSVIAGCKSSDNVHEKTFEVDKSNIINVKDKIKDIKTHINFATSYLYIMDRFLIVVEMNKGMDKAIHVYDKDTFSYLTSMGIIGQGPGEIENPGQAGIDEENRLLWLPDHNKEVMMKFHLDSVLANPNYKPEKAFDVEHDFFMARFGFLNDSIVLGKAIHPTSNSSFEELMAKHNVYTKKIEKYGYEHPQTVGQQSNSLFKLSLKHKMYVNAYVYCDLMTVCSLDGKLKYNLFGPDRFENKNNRKDYFSDVDFYNNYIIVSYLNDVGLVTDKFKKQTGNLPSKFLIFDLDGNLKRTIETGHKFTFFCVDETNQRVIAYFDDRENPLGYFNLDLD